MTAATQWTSSDEATPLAASDVSAFDLAEQAAHDLARLLMAAPGTMQVMRLCEAGGSPPMVPWCLTHHQPSSRCDLPGCDVALAPGHHDPTGQAGTTPDRAADDRRELARTFRVLATMVDKGLTIVDRYPSDAVLPEHPTGDGPGDDWCTNCYLDGQYFEPITMQKRKPTDEDPRTEVPYYIGKCKWCGDMNAAHGFYPPPNLSNLHHRNVRITAGMWAEAKKRTSPERTKNKKDKKGKAKAKRWQAEDLPYPPRT